LISLGALWNAGQSGRVFSAIGAASLSFSTRSAKIEPAWLGCLPHRFMGLSEAKLSLERWYAL
jgi:hypothetical protein